ncbi:MAG TPA: tryptophan 7-halogenase [Kofleriaceae bacterium]|nr:tryptophan 7-halogenase [Kofleriaceae bacterium]
MNAAADLVVVGGGPAGTAAGILARGRGLRVVLLEARRFPRHRPGETLHPGVEPILRQLGVLEAVRASSPLRPEAQASDWGGAVRTVPYGSDERGTWRAFQVLRSELDQILLDRFVALGGELVQPAPRVTPILEQGRVTGVRGDGLEVHAPVTIDASGAAGVLRRQLGISLLQCSPRLIAHYGYRRGVVSIVPKLSSDAAGWSWVAQVAPDLVSWTRLELGARGARPSPPGELAHLPEVGKRRAADVTWRVASRLAGPGYFLVGEAAAVLDPAASHGVLRALMTGMMAGYGAANLVTRAAHPELAAGAYASWLGSWFWNDVDAMRGLYEQAGVPWRAPSHSSSVQQHRT